jgi:hypothetical protein
MSQLSHDEAASQAQDLACKIVEAIPPGVDTTVAHMAMALALGTGIKVWCSTPESKKRFLDVMCGLIRDAANLPDEVVH